MKQLVDCLPLVGYVWRIAYWVVHHELATCLPWLDKMYTMNWQGAAWCIRSFISAVKIWTMNCATLCSTYTNCDVRCVSPNLVKFVTQFLCIVKPNILLRYYLYSYLWIKLRVLACSLCAGHRSPWYWTWFTMAYIS